MRPGQEAGRGCKGCGEEYRVIEERIDKLLAAPMFLPDSGACVPEDVYEARLSLCRACPKLIGDQTCALCGCFVRIAAKLKDRSCPAPGGAGWPAYGDGGSVPPREHTQPFGRKGDTESRSQRYDRR
ncbi:DUF6171 family protein [Cohnella hongkongensis]|uniref:DUF6171 family protein n=1 Tax=Cohnella hongkongensis TaxID=178337 RepID=A0ABV9F414_9BACL